MKNHFQAQWKAIVDSQLPTTFAHLPSAPFHLPTTLDVHLPITLAVHLQIHLLFIYPLLYSLNHYCCPVTHYYYQKWSHEFSFLYFWKNHRWYRPFTIFAKMSGFLCTAPSVRYRCYGNFLNFPAWRLVGTRSTIHKYLEWVWNSISFCIFTYRGGCQP